MKHARLILLSLPALLGSLSTVLAESPFEEYTALFNGTDLSGWHGSNPHQNNSDKNDQAAFAQSWAVENGVLVNNGEGPYATTDREYGDIELLLDYKISPGADSGVYLRGNPQVQIWDTTKAGGHWKHDADKGSGGLWNNPKQLPGRDPLVHADHAPGEWNHLRIRQIGSRTWVWLNDQPVVDDVIMENFWTKGETPLPAKGPIHLQTHGGEMRWRNIYIREIGPEEANQLLGNMDTAGFESMFNGVDFNGWEGAVDQYEIVDGSIRSLGRGNIFTKRVYGDFIWKLEFKVPPGGNNGLAIRYPGHGDPAYSGMCELQVLDNESPKNTDLDPRQYHGSAYGKAAAIRGYLRDANQWNYQEVRVVGSTIEVELNGTPILDTDLSTIKKFMKKSFSSDIPNDGHLGFAGHGKGIAFRNLQLLELPVMTSQ